MSYNLNISRNNFKQQRECYNITVKEIADICNLSPQTVINFEKGSGKYTDTMSRDYNSDMMIGTLTSLIESKLDDMKARHFEAITAVDSSKVDDPKKEVPEKKPYVRRNQSDVKRKDLVNYIRAYCEYNKIPLQEFCVMCKINTLYTSPSQERNAASEYASRTVLSKVVNATGWTSKQIKEGFKPDEEKPAFKLKLVDKKETDIPKHGDLVKKSTDVEKNVTNVRYICENGKFYKEYDIISHVSKEITMEDFMKEVTINE